MRIGLPPLRERREDIPLLVDHFIARFNRLQGREIAGVASDTLGVLLSHDYPGNIRELENIIERAVALSTGPVLDVADIRLDLSPAKPSGGDAANAVAQLPPPGMTLEQFEDAIIKEALRRANGNKSQAARLLGLSRNALRYRLSKMGVPDEES